MWMCHFGVIKIVYWNGSINDWLILLKVFMVFYGLFYSWKYSRKCTFYCKKKINKCAKQLKDYAKEESGSYAVLCKSNHVMR